MIWQTVSSSDFFHQLLCKIFFIYRFIFFFQNYASRLCRSHFSCRVSSDSITALLTHCLVSLLWTGRHDLIRRLWGWLKKIAFCLSLNYMLNVSLLLFKAIFIYYTGTTPAVTSTKHAFPCISLSYTQTHTHTARNWCKYTHCTTHTHHKHGR